MKIQITIIIISSLLFSCSKEDNTRDENNDSVQLIKSLSRDNETGIDSLLYENDRLKEIIEYYERGIDYRTFY